MAFFRNFNRNCCFHGIISHPKLFWSWNHFFNSIGVGTNFRVIECYFCKCYSSIFFVGNSFNFLSVCIFKNEFEFSVFKFTSSQFLRKVKFNFYWSYDKVVKLCIIIWCCFTIFLTISILATCWSVCNSIFVFTQIVIGRIFLFFNYNCCSDTHTIIINIWVWTSFFSDNVVIDTFFIQSNHWHCFFGTICLNHFFRFEDYRSIGFIRYILIDSWSIGISILNIKCKVSIT